MIMINHLSFPTTDALGLRWDDTAGGYRCPACDHEPRTVMFGPAEALVCSDCATYWLTPTAGDHRSTGRAA